jgi:hypothetical protein
MIPMECGIAYIVAHGAYPLEVVRKEINIFVLDA